ncbi:MULTISPECIES: hypothetical protein [Pseudomonas]|uniref:Uncharacterized protein n=2 Tax=Pseudomonas TaxID=286 RepID=A0A1H0JNW5_9PSED|nr:MULTISPECIES: hypothetical protein [Pseudomonas]MBO3274011.1 hypothetical protein [Pseudomonas schmalbachii]SDO45263.1 hypothetical protein SAMN05216193_111148 [Pseudomonas jinjuensis]
MKILDPLRLCREALDKFESGVNSLAASKFETREFARVLNRVSKVACGAKYVSERTLDGIQKCLGLPSRSEIDNLAALLGRVEDRIDQLTAPSADAASAPRPSRTRRPQESASSQPTRKKVNKGAGKPATAARQAGSGEVGNGVAS